MQVLNKEGKNIFKLLKTCGVNQADHLMAVQMLPSNKIDVTFTSPKICEQFCARLEQEADIDVVSYVKPVKVVTVLHVPHEVDDNAVRFVLKRYGKVLAGRYLTYKEYPDIFNGIRQYKMEVTTEIDQPRWSGVLGKV